MRAVPNDAAEIASRLVTSRGGYVASKETSGADGNAAKVDMVLRVPAAALESVLTELRKAGTLLAESQSGQDVTEEFTDTEAQLRAKRGLEERLLAIVASAKSVKEMLEVESELARVRGDIWACASSAVVVALPCRRIPYDAPVMQSPLALVVFLPFVCLVSCAKRADDASSAAPAAASALPGSSKSSVAQLTLEEAERELAQTEKQLGDTVALAAPDCTVAPGLRDRICELASETPEPAIKDRCTDGNRRCEAAKEKVSTRCD